MAFREDLHINKATVTGSIEDVDGNVLTSVASDGSIQSANLVYYTETVTYDQFTDGGATTGTLALSTTIPAGAVFLQSAVTDITGFTGDTSATLTIGDGTDVDRYNTGTPSVFTTAAAGVAMGAVSGTAWHTAAATPTLTVTSATDFTSVAAGAVTVHLWYLTP